MSIMIKRISARAKNFLSPTAEAQSDNTSRVPFDVDVREEYANAFRTESYNEFWTRVLAISSDGNSVTGIPVESTTAARLPSYRLFVEHLLEPDQPTVARILDLARNPPKTHSLLSEYFNQTANASFLCGLLLKDIDHARSKYRSLNATLQFKDDTYKTILDKLIEFTDSNPFHWSATSPNQVRTIQADSSKLLQRLESSRHKARSKLQLRSKLRHGSALFVVTLTASLTIILATHALALLVTAPGLITASLKLASSRRLAKVSAQLDMAAKGSYILCRDLETISRLVARLNDEMEHMKDN